MMLGRKSTEDRIADARAALAANEQRAAELERQRDAVLIDSDADVFALDRKITGARDLARVEQDRIAALQKRLVEEADQSRQKAYAIGVDRIEQLLPRREKAAADVEACLKALAAAVRQYDAVTETIRCDWPVNTVPRPGSDHNGYFSPFLLNLHRLEERLRRVLGAGPALRDIVRRVSDAGDRAEGFGESESKNSAELLAELRQRGAPKPVVADDDVEEAA